MHHARLVALLVLAGGTLSAQTILNDSVQTPTMLGTITGFYFDGRGQQYTNTQVDLAVFSFTGASSLTDITSISTTIGLESLNTLAPGSDNYGYIDLTINGIDTGIQVNGFGPSSTTATLSGNISSGTAAAILTSIDDGGYSYQVAAAGTTFRHGVPETIDSGNYSQAYTTADFPVYTLGTTSSGQAVLGLTLTGTSSTVYPNGMNTDTEPSQFYLVGGTSSVSLTGDDMSAVPEPSTYALTAGAAALAFAAYRRRSIPVA